MLLKKIVSHDFSRSTLPTNHFCFNISKRTLHSWAKDHLFLWIIVTQRFLVTFLFYLKPFTIYATAYINIPLDDNYLLIILTVTSVSMSFECINLQEELYSSYSLFFYEKTSASLAIFSPNQHRFAMDSHIKQQIVFITILLSSVSQLLSVSFVIVSKKDDAFGEFN